MGTVRWVLTMMAAAVVQSILASYTFLLMNVPSTWLFLLGVLLLLVNAYGFMYVYQAILKKIFNK